jgi:DNA-binding XRE family transcriptional regulator
MNQWVFRHSARNLPLKDSMKALAECLAAAAASPLTQVRERHLTTAPSWQTLLDTVMERKSNLLDLHQTALQKKADEEDAMSETDFEIPDPVIDAIEGGTPAVKAFRQSSGQSQHDVAADAGMTEERLAAIEQGSPPHNLELAVLSDVLDVPVHLLADDRD